MYLANSVIELHWAEADWNEPEAAEYRSKEVIYGGHQALERAFELKTSKVTLGFSPERFRAMKSGS